MYKNQNITFYDLLTAHFSSSFDIW